MCPAPHPPPHRPPTSRTHPPIRAPTDPPAHLPTRAPTQPPPTLQLSSGLEVAQAFLASGTAGPLARTVLQASLGTQGGNGTCRWSVGGAGWLAWDGGFRGCGQAPVLLQLVLVATLPARCHRPCCRRATCAGCLSCQQRQRRRMGWSSDAPPPTHTQLPYLELAAQQSVACGLWPHTAATAPATCAQTGAVVPTGKSTPGKLTPLGSWGGSMGLATRTCGEGVLPVGSPWESCATPGSKGMTAHPSCFWGVIHMSLPKQQGGGCRSVLCSAASQSRLWHFARYWGYMFSRTQ